MSVEDDDHPDNPYWRQTEANENTPWLTSADKALNVDVSLSGLQDYAKHVSGSQLDLIGKSTHLMQLSTMPADAFQLDVLGEVASIRSQMIANASEFTSYVGGLATTLANIGNAAQTIAEIYDSTDGTSAASLNDVLFAFGDPSAHRPSGAPKGMGKTYNELQQEQAANGAPAADSPLWKDDGTTHDEANHTTTQNMYTTDGQRMTVVTNYPPYGSGPTTVTTTFYNSKGKQVSSTSAKTEYGYDPQTQAYVKTVTSSDGKTVTGTQTTATNYDSKGEVKKETVTAADKSGATTGVKEKSVAGDGTQTETTEKAVTDPKTDKTTLEQTDQTVVGAETAGPTTSQADPLFKKYDRPSPGL